MILEIATVSSFEVIAFLTIQYYTMSLRRIAEIGTTILYCDPVMNCGDRKFDNLLMTILYCDTATHC